MPLPLSSASSAPARCFVRPGFRWDAAESYLFDIDGTLLHSHDDVHYRSFFSATEQVLGREISLEGVTVHGNTDPGILRDALRLARMDEAEWRPHAAAVLDHMARTVARDRARMQPEVLPGVVDALVHLQRKGACLGVATGNIETIGWIKLEQAGLREYFQFGGFSDGLETRPEMIRHALVRACTATRAGASVIVVGDTVHDITAARANGLPTIAVATGRTGFDELMGAEPEMCVSDLRALPGLSA